MEILGSNWFFVPDSKQTSRGGGNEKNQGKKLQKSPKVRKFKEKSASGRKKSKSKSIGDTQRKLAPGHHLHSFLYEINLGALANKLAERKNEVAPGPYLHGF